MKQKIDVVLRWSAQRGAKDALKEKASPFDKGLANLKELKERNLRRHNQFNIVPVSHCSPAVDFSHSANWAIVGIG